MHFFSANQALYFDELCIKNPKLCTNYVIQLCNMVQYCYVFVFVFVIFRFINFKKLLWFYFFYKIIHFQSENTQKFLLPGNELKQGAFFSFQAVIGYVSPSQKMCKTKPRQPAAWNAWNVLLICNICNNTFCNEAVPICSKKYVLYLWEKMSMHERNVSY